MVLAMPPTGGKHASTAARGGRVRRRIVGGRAGVLGLVFLAAMFMACLVTLPWTLAPVGSVAESAEGTGQRGIARYNAGEPRAGRLPPFWWPASAEQVSRLNALVDPVVVAEIGARSGREAVEVLEAPTAREAAELRANWPRFFLGTDVLGRSLLVRVLTGGGISLTIGLAAALISVVIGTLYGATAGYVGGRLDGVMMRTVDVLYGLPYVLLVVLLAVAVDAVIENRTEARVRRAGAAQAAHVEAGLGAVAPAERTEELASRLRAEAARQFPVMEMSLLRQNAVNVVTLLVAIGGVSWLTMARVVRGQVLSLKNQPFVEAARAVGASPGRIFARHLLPNLMGPIIVYATLTVPQAILQESFLSFLGIGVKPPLPSWGNLAAEGLLELNPYRSQWWLLFFPCTLLAGTLLALNFVGEGLREALDPRRAAR